MFNNEDNEFEFYEESGSINEQKLKEMYEESLEKSMRFAYSLIEEMGIDNWLKIVPMKIERKINIINNMIDWYENREEYEKCSILLKGKQSLEIK